VICKLFLGDFDAPALRWLFTSQAAQMGDLLMDGVRTGRISVTPCLAAVPPCVMARSGMPSAGCACARQHEEGEGHQWTQRRYR
jgi:hypothetical protein